MRNTIAGTWRKSLAHVRRWDTSLQYAATHVETTMPQGFHHQQFLQVFLAKQRQQGRWQQVHQRKQARITPIPAGATNAATLSTTTGS